MINRLGYMLVPTCVCVPLPNEKSGVLYSYDNSSKKFYLGNHEYHCYYTGTQIGTSTNWYQSM